MREGPSLREAPPRPSRTSTIAVLLALMLGAPSEIAAQTLLRFSAHPADQAAVAGGQLVGRLWTPAGPGPHPAVVMLHGCAGLGPGGDALMARDRDWALRFAALGHVVLHVDSFGPRGVDGLCSRRDRRLRPDRERARDAYAALAYLQSRPDVRSEAIALLGWSHGGSTALHAVSAGLPARPPGLRHDFTAAVAFYPGCRGVVARRGGWAPSIPVLILIGEADDWTPIGACRTLDERARAGGAAVELVAYPDAHHDFDAPDLPLRVRTNVATTRSGRATIGTDPAARADAIRRVPAFVARHARR